MEQAASKLQQSATVRVPLTVEQRAGRADEMARLIARIEGIETEAKEAAAEFRDEIKGLEAELRTIAAGVRDGVDERAQMDLTFTQAEAAKALATVGEAACTCDSPDAPVKSIDCPVHGVETREENPAVDEQGPIPAGLEPIAACCEHGVPLKETCGDCRAGDHLADGPGAEAAADFVVPEVETTAPVTPPVVDEFIAAQKSRRRRRAEA